jgi:hypothetical protein
MLEMALTNLPLVIFVVSITSFTQICMMYTHFFRRIMAGGFELSNFIIVKVPWFGFVLSLVCTCGSAHFIIRPWAVVQKRK